MVLLEWSRWRSPPRAVVREYPAMSALPDRVTCTVSIHPCSGDAVSVYTREFASAEQATTALRAALDGGSAFVITVYQPDQPESASAVVVHPANVALIQVHASSDTGTGQYL